MGWMASRGSGQERDGMHIVEAKGRFGSRNGKTSKKTGGHSQFDFVFILSPKISFVPENNSSSHIL